MSDESSHHLALFDLDQALTGYREFISCWLYRDDRIRLVVDPGPASTAPGLADRLRAAGVDQLDLILLTHIHLDHAGGAAELLAAYPRARWCCHPKGVAHLLDPARLWEGSLATIGDVAEAYGRPRPLPSDRRIDADDLHSLGVEAVETPGHAAHHLSFLAGSVLFAGEAIATRIPLADGRDYLRPATPPRFFPEVFLASLDRLAGLAPEPSTTAFAHYERAAGVRTWCERARAQLERWLAVARDAVAAGTQELEPLIDRLLEQDPDFGQGRFQALPADVQERERFYVGNSLRGLLQVTG